MRAWIALLFAAGCGGSGAIELTVTSSGVVRGVDALAVTVDNAGEKSQPAGFPFQPPVDISSASPEIVNLVLASDRQGAVTVHVEARAGQTVLAAADASGTVTPGALAHLTVVLPGNLGPQDMGAPPDLAGHPDLGTLPSSWTVSAFSNGLGGGVSSAAGFTLEGAVGVPGPRTTSSANGFSVEPLVPGR